MLRHLKNFLRLFRIAWVLARHDALFPLEKTGLSPVITQAAKFCAGRKNRKERPGVRLSRALQALGPTFIKLGQSLSTRADLMGEEIAADLSHLRDRLPAFPARKVHEAIEADLGQPVEALFREFNDEPVAAASIAQVHFATTQHGQEVAVKVLRPEIEAAFARDMELFFWLAELIETNLPDLRRLKPVEVVKTFDTSIRMELDLRYEAACARELRHNLRDDEGVYVPQIFWSLTGSRVMVMERVRGTPIGDIAALTAQGHDLQQLVQTAAEACFNMVYRDGFFHADMHPGNLFVLPDGRLGIVDFGIMGRVSKEERIYLIEILRGFLNEDYRHVAEVHFAAGYVPAHQSVDHFTLACAAIGRPILDKPLNEISLAQLLAQLFKVAETFEMETQPQLLLLQKTMMVAEGVGRMLVPNVNMWQLAEPLVTDWAHTHLGPAARLRTGLEQLSTTLQRLPATLQKLEHLLTKAEEEGITLHPDTLSTLNQQRIHWHRRWMLVAIAGFTAITTAILVAG